MTSGTGQAFLVTLALRGSDAPASSWRKRHIFYVLLSRAISPLLKTDESYHLLRNILARILALFALFVFAGAVYLGYDASPSNTYDPPPANAQEIAIQQDLFALLKQQRYSELDQKFDDLQKNYEHGHVTDIYLLHVSRIFYEISPEFESGYINWIKVNPRSYTARLARGIYIYIWYAGL